MTAKSKIGKWVRISLWQSDPKPSHKWEAWQQHVGDVVVYVFRRETDQGWCIVYSPQAADAGIGWNYSYNRVPSLSGEGFQYLPLCVVDNAQVVDPGVKLQSEMLARLLL